MAVYKVRKSLPVAHSREIGRIITRWAYLEWQLKNVSYVLLGITPKQGRLAIRETRPIEYVAMLEDLIQLAGISVTFNFKKFKTLVEILGNHRNMLAHSVWIKHPDFKDPVLQLTKGKWQPDPSRPSEKRTIHPEGVLIQVQELRQFVLLIDQAADAVGRLATEVQNALSASPAKSSE